MKLKWCFGVLASLGSELNQGRIRQDLSSSDPIITDA